MGAKISVAKDAVMKLEAITYEGMDLSAVVKHSDVPQPGDVIVHSPAGSDKKQRHTIHSNGVFYRDGVPLVDRFSYIWCSVLVLAVTPFNKLSDDTIDEVEGSGKAYPRDNGEVLTLMHLRSEHNAKRKFASYDKRLVTNELFLLPWIWWSGALTKNSNANTYVNVRKLVPSDDVQPNKALC